MKTDMGTEENYSLGNQKPIDIELSREKVVFAWTFIAGGRIACAILRPRMLIVEGKTKAGG
ncbi:MAG: hypothetical protein ACKVQK_06060 [Burkholderiales bacterium]